MLPPSLFYHFRRCPCPSGSRDPRKDDVRGFSPSISLTVSVIVDNAHIRLDTPPAGTGYRKRTVIVDQENHYPSTSDARSMAFITAFCLC